MSPSLFADVRAARECIECGALLVLRTALRCKSCNGRFINKGRVHTAATREKCRQRKIGYTPSIEQRRKQSEAQRGAKCYRWRGGRTSESERIRKSVDYKIWREAVYRRDNYTCQHCLTRGGKLNADHIFPFSTFPTLRLKLHNGQTLCVECHKKTPSYLHKMPTEPTTVRDMIHAIQREVRSLEIELTQDRAAELLVRLSALLGNCLEEIREADMAYAEVLLSHLESEEAANRAKIRAQTTQEYRRAREAKDTRELTIELSRSLKYYLKAKAEEWQASR